MLFVNNQNTWPQVLAGRMSPADSVLGDWAAMAEAKLHQYADVIAAVTAGVVVAAYDVQGWDRVADGRVRFRATTSTRWAHLVGAPSPVVWTRGQARPVRYVETAQVAASTGAPLQDGAAPSRDRVSAGGWTLQVDGAGDAILHAPAGGRVTMITAPTAPGAPVEEAS